MATETNHHTIMTPKEVGDKFLNIVKCTVFIFPWLSEVSLFNSWLFELEWLELNFTWSTLFKLVKTPPHFGPSIITPTDTAGTSWQICKWTMESFTVNLQYFQTCRSLFLLFFVDVFGVSLHVIVIVIVFFSFFSLCWSIKKTPRGHCRSISRTLW